MDRKQVAQILEEIAAMMELAEENPFKVRAYENGARAILGFPGDLAEAVRTGKLRGVAGIGAGLFDAVATLLATGQLPLHDELSARFPPGLRECLRIPGLGARKVRLLRDSLGIDSLEALERACLEGRLEAVKGFGAKSAAKILRAIAMLRARVGNHRFDRALALSVRLLEEIRATGLASRVELAGSLRRCREIVRDIDLVASSPDPAALVSAFSALPGIAEPLGSQDGVVRVRLAEGIAADLVAVSEEDFAGALLFFTGSPEHLTELAALAASVGLRLGSRGLLHSASGERVATASEEEIYALLGLAWIAPEVREGREEVEAARRGALPRLVETTDLRGLIHVHTTDSDGRDTLEEMVTAVSDAGYGYVAITDHSKTAGYAGGLDETRMLAQRERIRGLSRHFPDLRIFHGTEADILADGSIDFGDEFLGIFDLVVASIHSRFGLSRQEQTERLVRAVRNPRVSILGHPTGRLLLSREGIDVDIEAVIEAAAQSGCALEINCSPERLELDWRFCRKAVEKGVPLSVDPDAHSVAELDLVSLGIGVARKGWVTPSATLNAKTADQLAAWLERRKATRLAQ